MFELPMYGIGCGVLVFSTQFAGCKVFGYLLASVHVSQTVVCRIFVCEGFV